MAKEAAVSSVVQVFLTKFISAVENKGKLLFGIEKERQKLVSNMSRITAVIQDAGSRQVLNESAKDWLQKLNDVANDAEKLLNEIDEGQRRKGGIGKKFRNFFSPFNPLCFRYRMAHKIQKLRKRLDVIAKENNDFPSLGAQLMEDMIE